MLCLTLDLVSLYLGETFFLDLVTSFHVFLLKLGKTSVLFFFLKENNTIQVTKCKPRKLKHVAAQGQPSASVCWSFFLIMFTLSQSQIPQWAKQNSKRLRETDAKCGTTSNWSQARENHLLIPSAAKPPTGPMRGKNPYWPQVWENLRVPSARKPATGSECGKTSNGSQARKSPSTFLRTNLDTWVERNTVRVKCLAHMHNAMIPASTRNQTAQSKTQCVTHPGIAALILPYDWWQSERKSKYINTFESHSRPLLQA